MQPSTTLEPAAPATTLIGEERLAGVGLARYCLGAGVVALVGSTVLLALADAINELVHVVPPLHAGPSQSLPSMVFGTMVFGPFVETALLIGLLKLLVRARLPKMGAVVVAAIVWGLLHGTLQSLRFFGSVWSFAVFGYSYFLWHGRQPRHGFAAAAWPHVLVNTVATAVMFFAP